MSRFVEYFAIIGIDPKDKVLNAGDKVFPDVLQMIPPNKWDNFEFPPGLSNFCLPSGWYVCNKWSRPLFYSNVLTNVDGSKCYCGTLICYENIKGTELYIPKALTIVSKFAYLKDYRNILASIFITLSNIKCKEKLNNAERIISHLIYRNIIADAGSESFDIKLSSYTLRINPPISNTIPSTDDNVATLMRLVGINNLVYLYSAILLDNKIAFISKSYNYLYKCSQALISLIYPIKYCYIFIPVLPSNLTDIINAPTPYVVGVHSECEIDLEDLTDTLVMNLDINLLIQHENHKIPQFPSKYLSDILNHHVLLNKPDLITIDNVIDEKIIIDNNILDKNIRACFFYSTLKLLAGYRPCTTYARLVPVPIMKFHSDLFIARSPIEKCEYYNKFFNTTSFNSFINERGSTYRYVDYFDEIINNFGYKNVTELNLQLEVIDKISKHFINNELGCGSNTSGGTASSSVGSVGGSSVGNSVVEVNNDEKYIKEIDYMNLSIRSIDIEKVKYNIVNKSVVNVKNKEIKENVPLNLSLFEHDMVYYIGHRRKDMIIECISLIFANKISDSLKLIHAVMESLSSISCRIALINELIKYKSKDRTILTSIQLSLISQLLNGILINDKSKTCYSSSVQILKLSCNYCQMISDKKEFLYLSLQNHVIWKDINFWINYYFYETQTYLIELHNKNKYLLDTNSSLIKEEYDTVYHPELNKTLEALKVSTQILSIYENSTSDDKKEMEQSEISFLYSQTIDTLYKMSYMLIDMESLKQTPIRESRKETNEELLQRIKNEKLNEITEMMKKFLSTVNLYVCLKVEMIDSLKELIRNILETQYEEIINIRNLSKKTQLIEIEDKLKPIMLYENENILYRINAYTYYKKIDDYLEYDTLGTLNLLPAEGYLYITNKRIIFIGKSMDPFLSDFIVYISYPCKYILKFKIYDSGIYEYDDKIKFQIIIQIKTKSCQCINFGILNTITQTNIVDMIKKALKLSIYESPKMLRISPRIRVSEQHHNVSTLHKKDPTTNTDTSSTTEFNKGTLSKRSVVGNSFMKRLGNFSTIRSSNKQLHLQQQQQILSSNDILTSSSNIITLSNSNIVDRDNCLKSCSFIEFNRMGISMELCDKNKSNWRISNMNKLRRITYCLPQYFLVPVYLSDESLISCLKIFRHKRLPVGTYINSGYISNNNGGIVFDVDSVNIPKMYTILRSEFPLKTISLASSQKTNTPASKVGSEYINMYLSIANTQEINRKKCMKDEYTFKNLANNFNLHELVKKLNNCEFDYWIPSLLYIFYDRNYVRTSSSEKICCVPIENITISEIKKSYEAFQHAFWNNITSLTSSSSSKKDKKTFYEIINDSHWLYIVNRCIVLATSGLFITEICNSSLLYSFSNGSDITSILVSLTQILIDPYYRTFIGFQKLLEKDWFDYGYNFFSRNYIDFIPIFILFLDCIYQIILQFPHAFEFNTYYLSFLAFHNFSLKYDTFMFGDDTVETINTNEDISNTIPSDTNTLDDNTFSDRVSISPNSGAIGANSGYDSLSILPNPDSTSSEYSIFKIIQTYIECSTIFHNMYYDHQYTSQLYPTCQISSLEIWPFYYINNYQIPCMYNLETLDDSIINIVHNDMSNINKKSNNNVDTNNDFIIPTNILPTTTYKYTGDGTPYVLDSISWLLFEIGQLNDELDRYAQPMNQFLLSSKISYFNTSILFSSQRFIEFLYYRAITYCFTEPPKMIKNEFSDKNDQRNTNNTTNNNLHLLSHIDDELLYFSICCVCGFAIPCINNALVCTKCHRIMHNSCQQYSYMLCDSAIYGNEHPSIINDKNELNQFKLYEDDKILKGKLYTKKRMKNSWLPKYYIFNKRTQTLSVFLQNDFNNTLPYKTFHLSQLSCCFEVKTLPSNVPKEMLFSSGAFEVYLFFLYF